MRRKRANKRNQVILGLLVSVLVGGTLFYIHYVVAGETSKTSGKAAVGAKTTRTRAVAHKPAPGKPQRKGYAVIAERNLFQPLVAPKAETPPPVVKPKPVQVSPPIPTFTLPATPPITETHNPTLDKVTVVGMVQMGNEMFALVEDVTKGETRFVRAGESAFGYTVKAARGDDAVLERDGQTFAVAMGENKVAAPIRPGMGMVRTFTPGGGAMPGMMGAPPAPTVNTANFAGGIPDLANMNSDQRRQWFEQWRQSFQNMTPEQQEQARQQMRDYWRQRAEQGGFGGGGGRDGGFGRR